MKPLKSFSFKFLRLHCPSVLIGRVSSQVETLKRNPSIGPEVRLFQIINPKLRISFLNQTGVIYPENKKDPEI
jgi:hypothetical protein